MIPLFLGDVFLFHVLQTLRSASLFALWFTVQRLPGLPLRQTGGSAGWIDPVDM